MRAVLGHILLCLTLMFSLGVKVAAMPQGDNYDRALDKYAAICDRCVGLRAKVEAGESVRTESLKSLLTELSSLRKTLSNASGKMSAAQVERFEAIKAKYLQGMKAFEKPAEESERTLLKPLPRLAAVPSAIVVPSDAEITLRQRFSSKESLSKPFRLAVLADAGMFPTPSYGAMVVATWKGIGAYATYRSDFRKNEYSYVCTSAGDTEYGRIWATGESRVSRSVATAGFAMFTSRRFGFRAGAGMTSYTSCWEDVSGQWAKVKGKSYKSPAADAGIFLTFSRLIISAGVVSDFSGHADLQFGVGVRF